MQITIRPEWGVSMSVYLAIAVKSFQKHLTYRAANLAGIITNMFFGAVYVFVYVALFEGRTTVGGLDVRDAVTYVVLTQALLMAMSAFGNRELSESIMKGQIASDLSRPLDFYLYWAAIDLGRAVYYLIFRGIPTFAIGLILFRRTAARQSQRLRLAFVSLSGDRDCDELRRFGSSPTAWPSGRPMRVGSTTWSTR